MHKEILNTMKRLKSGIVALVVAALAISAVAVAAQSPSATATPSTPAGQSQAPAQGQGQFPGRGMRGFGGDFQAIADALGIDLATLQSDLQSGKTIADIAKEKNVELSTIVDAVVAKAQETLTTAVTDGRLTQEQVDAQIALLKANLNVMFTRTFDQQMGNRPGFGMRGAGNLDIVATALGVDAATLQSDLQSGKTIADIAKEKSVDLSTVVDAVVAERETALKAAVTAGRLTQEQADAELALFKTNLTAAFSQPMNANGRDGMGMGGFDGQGGFDGRGNGGPMGGNGNGGMGGRGHGNGNGGPMGPKGNGAQGNNAPVAPDATPEATAAANA
jgi:hypothetical protein